MPVADTLKNATYVTIGFGVLGFQKLQVRRHELSKQLSQQWPQVEAQLAEGRKTVTSLAAELDGYVVPVRAQVETGLDNSRPCSPDRAGSRRAGAGRLVRAGAGPQGPRLGPPPSPTPPDAEAAARGAQPPTGAPGAGASARGCGELKAPRRQHVSQRVVERPLGRPPRGGRQLGRAPQQDRRLDLADPRRIDLELQVGVGQCDEAPGHLFHGDRLP